MGRTTGTLRTRESLAESIRGAARNRKGVIAVTALLVLLGVTAASLAVGPRYTATATVVLRSANAPALTPGGTVEPARAAATDRAFLSLPVVAGQAARLLGGETSGADVARRIDVESTAEADAVQVEATADSRMVAARTANAYVTAYVTLRRQSDQRQIDDAIRLLRRELAALGPGQQPIARSLQARIAELSVSRSSQTGNAAVVQRADAPSASSADDLWLVVLLGLLAGLLLGFLLALLLERFDRRLKSIEDLEAVYDLPVIARVPRSRSLGKGSRRSRGDVLSRTVGMSEEAEAFRTLRANLRYFKVDRPVRSVLVVSPLSGDGKSTVARGLAATMASMGDSVVLVDADLRKTAQGDVTEDDEGLSLVLAGFDLDSALAEVPVAFDVVSEKARLLAELPSGPLPPNPSELLESKRMRWVVGELEERFETVIIDSPALVSVSDALALVPAVSGVLIVSGFDQTTRHAALDLRRQLSLLGGRSLGVVANFRSPQQSDYYNDPG